VRDKVVIDGRSSFGPLFDDNGLKAPDNHSGAFLFGRLADLLQTLGSGGKIALSGDALEELFPAAGPILFDPGQAVCEGVWVRVRI